MSATIATVVLSTSYSLSTSTDITPKETNNINKIPKSDIGTIKSKNMNPNSIGLYNSFMSFITPFVAPTLSSPHKSILS